MNISDLKTGMGSVDVKGKAIKISEPRDVQTKYGPNRVADVTLQDDTGTISLTLWGDQISLVKEGDDVQITGGYVREWNGELQLGVARAGEIKVGA